MDFFSSHFSACNQKLPAVFDKRLSILYFKNVKGFFLCFRSNYVKRIETHYNKRYNMYILSSKCWFFS